MNEQQFYEVVVSIAQTQDGRDALESLHFSVTWSSKVKGSYFEILYKAGLVDEKGEPLDFVNPYVISRVLITYQNEE